MAAAGAQASRPLVPSPSSWRSSSCRRRGSSVVLQMLVESRCLARLMVAFCEVGCVASCVGIKAGSEFEIAVLFVAVGGDRFAPRGVFVGLGQCRRSSGRAGGLADCDRTDAPDG